LPSVRIHGVLHGGSHPYVGEPHAPRATLTGRGGQTVSGARQPPWVNHSVLVVTPLTVPTTSGGTGSTLLQISSNKCDYRTLFQISSNKCVITYRLYLCVSLCISLTNVRLHVRPVTSKVKTASTRNFGSMYDGKDHKVCPARKWCEAAAIQKLCIGSRHNSTWFMYKTC